MAELKTKPTDESVVAFLNKVENDRRRQDSFKVAFLNITVDAGLDRFNEWDGTGFAADVGHVSSAVPFSQQRQIV